MERFPTSRDANPDATTVRDASQSSSTSSHWLPATIRSFPANERRERIGSCRIPHQDSIGPTLMTNNATTLYDTRGTATKKANPTIVDEYVATNFRHATQVCCPVLGYLFFLFFLRDGKSEIHQQGLNRTEPIPHLFA